MFPAAARAAEPRYTMRIRGLLLPRPCAVPSLSPDAREETPSSSNNRDEPRRKRLQRIEPRGAPHDSQPGLLQHVITVIRPDSCLQDETAQGRRVAIDERTRGLRISVDDASDQHRVCFRFRVHAPYTSA